MIKVAVLYPAETDASFDHDYFLNRHMPLVADRLGDALLGYEAEQGIAGASDADPPPFMAAVHMRFDSVDAFQGAFGPAADELLADIPNYTNATPVMQISELRGRYSPE